MAQLFGNSQETVQSKFLGAGIHDFKVKEIYFQPKGNSVKGATKKDGSIVTFNNPSIMIDVEVLATYAGKDSVGVETQLPVFQPQLKGDDKDKGRMDRLFHIFVNIVPSEKKESFRAWLQKQNFAGNTFDEQFASIATVLAKVINGKNLAVRYKLIANQEGKYAQFPSYFSGFAEPQDVDFSKTTLKFDDATEGNVTRNNTEMPTTTNDTSVTAEDVFGTGETAADDLPF